MLCNFHKNVIFRNIKPIEKFLFLISHRKQEFKSGSIMGNKGIKNLSHSFLL